MPSEFKALRVTQLDADALDVSLLDTIMAQVNVFVNTLPIAAGNWLRRVEPELRFVVKTMFHFGMLHKNGMLPRCVNNSILAGATFGQQLLAMRYASSPTNNRRLWLFYVLTVLLPYLAQRWHQILSVLAPRQLTPARRRKLELLTERAVVVCDMMDLVHFVLFLRFGGHRSLAERVTQLRAVHEQVPELRKSAYPMAHCV